MGDSIVKKFITEIEDVVEKLASEPGIKSIATEKIKELLNSPESRFTYAQLSQILNWVRNEYGISICIYG